MAKVKNYAIHADETRLNALQADYVFLGREVRREPGTLVVLALPTTYKRKERLEAKARRRREEREDDLD